jgi:hypothetical protein
MRTRAPMQTRPAAMDYPGGCPMVGLPPRRGATR